MTQHHGRDQRLAATACSDCHTAPIAWYVFEAGTPGTTLITTDGLRLTFKTKPDRFEVVGNR